MDIRTEVREFLQSRRARLSPERTGLDATGTRRRVPGLRREEVAMLAGVSVDYYARLEKGHLETASAAVLDAIARSLQLDEAERSHLFALAKAAKGETGDTPSRLDGVVRPGLMWMLDAMRLIPAYLRNSRLDVLESNAMGRALYEPMFHAADDTPNLALFCFLDSRARTFFPDWPSVAQGMAALLRAELGHNSSDPALNQLTDRLVRGSEAFRTLWASHDVLQAPAARTTIQHPTVGTLSLALEALNLAPGHGLTMVAYAAEPGSVSEDGLHRLAEMVAGHPDPIR